MPRKASEGEYELVPVSPIKRLEREIEELKGRKVAEVPIEKLGANIDKLNEQVSKLITVNINLQAKMTELLIKNAELIEGVTEMVQLLKRASEVEAGPSVETMEERPQLKIDMGPVVNELKNISTQNAQILSGFAKLNEYMQKDYRKEMLGRVLDTPASPARPEAMPTPPPPPIGEE
jgi:hypothetical protein